MADSGNIFEVFRRNRSKSMLLLGTLSFIIIYSIYFTEQINWNQKPDFTSRDNLLLDVRPQQIFGSENDVIWTGDDVNIPHIIHQTAIDEKLPILLKPWMQSWLKQNPKWQYWFWTDEDILLFISTRYPNFMPLFDAYEMGVARADVFRYFALYEFGGVYADTDIQCLRPLDEKMSEHQSILSQEPYLHAYFHYRKDKLVANSLIASRPRHPFYKFMINRLDFYARFDNVIYQTGPGMIDHVYDTFLKQNKNNPEDIPHLAEPEEYQPKIDPRKEESYTRLCRENDRQKKDFEFKAKICQELLSGTFVNGPKETSITVHHWTHMWKPKYKNDAEYGVKQKYGTFHIRDLFEGYV